MPEKEKGGSGVVEKKDQEIQIRLVNKDFFEKIGSSTSQKEIRNSKILAIFLCFSSNFEILEL